jgi:hypothetical protein
MEWSKHSRCVCHSNFYPPLSKKIKVKKNEGE